MNIDIYFFHLINDLAGQSKFYDWFFIFLAQYLPYITVATALILLVLWKKSVTHKLQFLFVFCVIAGLSYLFIYFVIHPIWPRQRPFFELEGVRSLIDTVGNSFPSKHAFFFFVLATMISGVRNRVGFWFFIIAILIALGRVFVGVHYPLDVLAGAIFGIIMGWVGVKIVRKL